MAKQTYDRTWGSFSTIDVEPRFRYFVNGGEIASFVKAAPLNKARRDLFMKERYAFRPQRDMPELGDIYDLQVYGHFEFRPAVLAPDRQGALHEVLSEVNDWVAGICMNGKLKVWID